MSDVAFAQSLFRDAFPKARYGKVDALVYAAYRYLKPRVEPRLDRPFTLRRCETLFRGKVRRVDGAEQDALKQAKLEEARREYRELKDRLASMEAALAVADEEFHGPQMDAYRRSAAPVGSLDRTGTGGGAR